jgi:hypothetical protein
MNEGSGSGWCLAEITSSRKYGLESVGIPRCARDFRKKLGIDFSEKVATISREADHAPSGAATGADQIEVEENLKRFAAKRPE